MKEIRVVVSIGSENYGLGMVVDEEHEPRTGQNLELLFRSALHQLGVDHRYTLTITEKHSSGN